MFAAAVACTSVGWGLWQQAEYEWKAQHQSAEQASYARDYIRDRCLSLALLDKIDCATKARDEHRAYQRDEQDLVAQKTSALWTMIMGWAATFGMVLSAVGVYLIWTTFAEARKGNAIAAHAQRPWISISIELMDFELIQRRAFSLDWIARFNNTGQMVAENFHVQVKFVPMNDQFNAHMKGWFDKFQAENVVQDAVVIPGDTYEWAGRSSHAIDVLPWPTEGDGRLDCYLTILAMSRYRVPGDATWRFAMQGFSVGQNISLIDDRSFHRAFPDDLALSDMVVKKMGRSRAT